MSVKRYEPFCCETLHYPPQHECVMRPINDATDDCDQYVEATDYDAVAADLASMTFDRNYHRDAALKQSVYWRNHYEDRIAELEAENARLNMEMVAYREKLTPKDVEAMTAVIKALTEEKTARATLETGEEHGG